MERVQVARVLSAGERAGFSQRLSPYVLASAFVIVVGAVARRACLDAGFYLDDYNQQSLITGSMLSRRGLWDLHVAVRAGEAPELIRYGLLPWWTDPHFVFAALRPLSSPLVWFEYHRLKVPFGMHCVSMALWCALSALIARFYRAILSPRAALLSTAMFALSPIHCESIAWAANQALLLAGLLGVLSLNAYERYRRRRSRLSWSVHAASYTLALASGEYALSMLGYFAAYEVFVARDEPRVRVRALVFPVLASAVYLFIHFWSYGVHGAGSYADIFGAPAQLMSTVAQSIPSHVVHGITLHPIPMGTGGYAGWSIALVMALILLVRSPGVTADDSSLGRRRAAYALSFWLFGGILAAGPYGAVHYWERLGVLPQIGFSATTAIVVDAVWQKLDGGFRGRNPSFWCGAAAASFFAAVHLVYAVYRTNAEAREIVERYAAHNRRARNAPVEAAPGDPPVECVFLMSALNVPIAQTMPLARLALSRPFAIWRVLSPAVGPHVVARTSERTIVLRTMTLGIFTNPSIEAYRTPEKGLEPGTLVITDDVTVKVLERTRKGPSLVEFTFAEPLESPHYRFLLPAKEGFVEFPMPPVGTPALVPAAVPPAGLDVE